MNRSTKPGDELTEQEVAAVVAVIAAYLDVSPDALRLASVKRTELPVRSIWGLVGRQLQQASHRLRRTRGGSNT